MNANLIKLMAAIIMVMLTIIVSTLETVGAVGTTLYVFIMLLCLLVIGVDFKITKDETEEES